MSKYLEPSEDIVRIVKEIATELSLDGYGIDVQPLCVTKAKEVCKIVKANDLAEYASKRDNLVFVLCYEDAFNGADMQGHPYVEEKTKYMWIRTEMEKISYDVDKDKLVIGCPSITIPVGFYETYKEAAVNSALLGQYVIAQIEEQKKELAAAKKAQKTKSKTKSM